MLDELLPLDFYFADLHAPCTEDEKAFLATLMAVSREGHLCLDLDQLDTDSSWKQKVIAGSSIASPYIRQHGPLFYLEKNYTTETQILHHLERLSFPVKPLDFPSFSDLTDEQSQALHLVLSNTISIIEGGPGTGKTYLTSRLVQAMGPSSRVILAAPTGKAAARLKQFNPQATCGTLHSLVGIHSKKSSLEADLIIIDESSMIDARLFGFFLGSLQHGQKVVFLGDGHQLPPVESGSLFGDLVDLLPTAHLRKCLRSDRLEILQLAHHILSGQPIVPHESLSYDSLLQKAIHGWTILSPVREGPFGVNVLNDRISRYFLGRLKPDEQLAVPILITRTDYQLGLYNGETGTLWRTREKLLYAEFHGQRIPASALPPYELGYVLSVHKSQGSEFDHVVVLVPPGSESFGREVLYTAVTRAKLSVTICGDADTLQKTLSRSSRRQSGLRERWKIHTSESKKS